MQLANYQPSNVAYDPFSFDLLNHQNYWNLLIKEGQLNDHCMLNVSFGEFETDEPLCDKRKDRKKKMIKMKKAKRYTDVPRRKWTDFAWRKKTHVHKFHLRQKKHKRPNLLPKFLLLGPKFVRYGHFCGVRDSRASKCPFRGASREKLVFDCKNCICQTFSIYSSPLAMAAHIKSCGEDFETSFDDCCLLK